MGARLQVGKEDHSGAGLQQQSRSTPRYGVREVAVISIRLQLGWYREHSPRPFYGDGDFLMFYFTVLIHSA